MLCIKLALDRISLVTRIFCWMVEIARNCTVYFGFNIVNCLQNAHPLANTERWDMACPLWVSMMICRIMHELPWIKIFWSLVRWFANDFHVTHENHWQVIRPCSDPLNCTFTKTIINRLFCHSHQGWSFLAWHCDVTTVDLWCDGNASY